MKRLENMTKKISIFLLLFFLLGCVATQKVEGPIKWIWVLTPSETMQAEHHGSQLANKDGSSEWVLSDYVKNIVDARKKIGAISGVETDLGFVDSETPTAYFFVYKNRPVVAFAISFLRALGTDKSAIAVVLAHEYAHVKLSHHAVTKDKNISDPLNALILAALESRDQERAADELGLKWAIEAGFDPCGLIRAVWLSGDESQKTSPLSPYPSAFERIGKINELSVKTRGKPCAGF
ncbi:MAG: hypothetical protein V1760_02020 [Candidatus Peregrinibacteria bacterium]|uniref:Putative peptidase n=1 Tax=viral metagenome TaxID=1070528 RepID=A0A6H1ZXG5_9ZZZZ